MSLVTVLAKRGGKNLPPCRGSWARIPRRRAECAALSSLSTTKEKNRHPSRFAILRSFHRRRLYKSVCNSGSPTLQPATGLIRRPRILIAEEPTSRLDLSVETALHESLAQLNRTERPIVILVIHDLAVAARAHTSRWSMMAG